MSKKDEKTKGLERLADKLFKPPTLCTDEQILAKCETISANIKLKKDGNTIINCATKKQDWLGESYSLSGDTVIKGKRTGADEAFDWIHLKPGDELEAVAFIGGDEKPRAFWIAREYGVDIFNEMEMLYVLAISQISKSSGEIGLLTCFSKGELNFCIIEGDPDLEAVRKLIANVCSIVEEKKLPIDNAGNTDGDN